MEKPLKTTLANGLRVILLEKHDAPVVSWNLWANVGSVNETDGIAGICHLIEHMIFKGTSRRPVGQIAKEVEAAGGDMNAYTSFDETVFYINMSKRKMEVGLDVLADAAADPAFDETELAREKEVVVEEISRAEDNPSQMVSEDLFAKAYQVHPYRRPIAGDRNTVRQVSRETLLEFYRRWYVGSNLIFIGVGDFKADQTAKKIEALFAALPAGQPPAQQIPREPAQQTPRCAARGMTIEGFYLDAGVPIPEFRHRDTPVLDLLAQILGGGPSSRLEQVVKEKKRLVTSIAAASYTPRHPGLLIASAVLKDGRVREPLRAIWEEMDRLRQARVTPSELARARENIRSTRVYEKQTADRLARKLGFFEGITGDLACEEEYYRRIAAASEEEILEAARNYLRPERLTASLCHPKGKLQEGLEPAIRSLAAAPRRRPSKAAPSVHRFRLSSGVRLLVRENHALPIVAVRSASLGGLRGETARVNGISHLASLLLTKGTGQRTAREIAEAEENMSGHFSGYTGWNLTGMGALFLSEKISEGTELFFDLLLNPSFPEEEVAKEKGVTLNAIRTQEDSLSYVAVRNFLARLYGRHPYGLPLLGTMPSVRRLRRAEMETFYRKIISPRNLVLAVAGDVDPKEIRERVEGKFRGHGRIDAASRNLPFRPPQQPLETTARRKEKFQAHLVYGFPATTLRNRDRYPLEVMNSILAGQGGRLFLELRDKQGLAYAISSSSQEGIEPGYFMVYMGCDPVKLETALDGIRRELGRIASQRVSGEELSRAKRYIVGNYEIELQKQSAVASILASDEIHGIGWEELFRYPGEIEKVTVQDVLRVAKKYIRPKNSVLSIVKP